jgi:predicted alpha/beta hydrolase family esterase
VAHWAEWATAEKPESLRRVKAAFLVAAPDPAGPEFPAAAAGFAPVPRLRLPFPSLLVASSDDPYSTLAYSRACAAAWGSSLAEIGARGHINSSSNLGEWDEGRELLSRLAGG